jgi:hypothetical protein
LSSSPPALREGEGQTRLKDLRKEVRFRQTVVPQVRAHH